MKFHTSNVFSAASNGIITAYRRSLRRLSFYTSLSVILFMGGGANAWWGVYMAGECVCRRHTWQGACMVRGMHGIGACLAGGMHGRGGKHGRGVMHGGGSCMTGGMHSRGVCVAGVHGRGHAWQEAWGHACHACPLADTTRYGQWVGSTHPTGMHSCFWKNSTRRCLTITETIHYFSLSRKLSQRWCQKLSIY